MPDPIATIPTTDRVKELFVQASELPRDARQAYLERQCGTDASLRDAVESLLTAEDDAGEFLAGPTAGGPTVVASESSGKAPRQQIGPYKLLQVIGEGGFGSVYLAEQSVPVRRRVALKLIKLGMDTAEIIARFDVERQALAMMDHPGIAKVFDASATDTGRPYFVMELVRGVPITAYCDQQQLDVRARLRLFAQVCTAVQHAHTKGIIHRDLKPSNVLVSTQDDRPLAKIIDFGIAKATTPVRLTDHTLFTEYHQFIGSPEYMSPEQAEGNLDVDTRSDVFSLGAMLYELLTGTTPLDTRALRKKTYAQIQQAIREVDPPKPSTRLGLLNQPRTPSRSAAQIRGELDWICMKAMEKDRARRYETAAALTADIERYLSHEAVTAVKPSRAYLLRKFARRHRTVVIAASAVFVALLAGVIGTSVALIGQARERKIAQQERAVAEAVSQFQSDMLRSADPDKMFGDKVTVVQAMDAAIKKLDEGKFADQPLVEASVRFSIGATLRELGRFKAAEPNLRRALTLRRSQLGDQHKLVGNVLSSLGLTLQAQGKWAEAEPLLREGLAIERAASRGSANSLAIAANNVALVLDQQGRFAEGETLYRESLALRRRALPPDDPSIATSLNNLAACLYAQGKLAEAEPMYREALELRRRIYPAGHRQIALTLNNLAMLMRSQSRFADAEPLSREALEIQRAILPAGHIDNAKALSNLSWVLRAQGKLDEAEPLIQEAMQISRNALPAGHADIATAMIHLASLRSDQGRLADAEEITREALEMHRRALRQGHPQIAADVLSLASLLRDRNAFAEAEPLYREAVASLAAVHGKSHWRVANAQIGLGRTLAGLARFADAESELIEAERSISSASPNTPSDLYAHVMDAMIDLYERWNKHEPSDVHAAELARWRRAQAATRPSSRPTTQP